MKFTVFALLFMALAAWAWGQTSTTDFLAYLPKEDQQSLLKQGELVVFGDKLDDLRLWKGSPFAKALQDRYNNRPTSLVAECLFVIDRPPVATERELFEKIFKSITAFSHMKGLQVYSASLKKMETFIFESYQVGSIEHPSALADPEIGSDTEDSHFLVYEKEEQTGDMFNEYVFSPHGTWYEVRLENLAPIKYGPFTLVDTRKLLTSYYLFPTKDKIIVYGINLADTLRFLGIEKTKRDSFSNRMRAIESWFSSGLLAQSSN